MTKQFDDFKQLLGIATTDTDFVRKNTAMQDTTYATAVSTRISALSEHYNFDIGSDNVASVNGLVTNDTDNRQLKLNALAAKNVLVDSLEHDAMTPIKIWVRTSSGVTPADGIRYVITCSDVGVLFANESGELVGSLPGFGDEANDGYADASAAITFTVGTTEYIAVAMASHSIVRVYAMSDWSLITTIGTLDTPGLPDADDLTSPVDLAFGTITRTGTGDTIGGTAPAMTLTDAGASFTAADIGRSITLAGSTTPANDGTFVITAVGSSTEITYTNASGVAESFTSGTWSLISSTLYIADDTGVALVGGGSLPGFVCSFNFEAPATPVFGAYLAVNDGGKLLHGQVAKPPFIQFDSTKRALWAVSYDDTGASDVYELGALKLSVDGLTATGALDGYILTKQYLYEINDIFLNDTTRKLYVGGWNSVEVFDADTQAHETSYGYYSQEFSATPLQIPPVLRMNFSGIIAIASDTVTIDGVSVDILLTSDSNRIIRTSENIFGLSNYATFTSESPVVPVALEGYVLKGTLPSQNVIVQYRTSTSGEWHTLVSGCNADASVYYEFRVKLFVGPYDAIQDYTIDKLIVVGRQA